jgi:phosphinothricin acetyltransferase
MEIRLARVADAEAIQLIYNAEVTNGTNTFDLVPRSLADQRRWLEEHAGVHPAIVAVDGGDLVGFGSLSPYRDRPAYTTSVEDSVYVRDDCRGRGVGKLLLDELVRLARLHGFHTVIARVVGHNETSIGLHRSCGFELVGVEREIGRKLGQWLDVVELQLML